MHTTKANLAGLGWLTNVGLLFALLVHASASAADIAWTNTAGGNWNVVANWRPNQVPAASDTAVITNAGTYTVTLNASPTIAGLLLGGTSGRQTFAMAANTLTLNGAGQVNSNGQWNLAGGTLSGAHVVTVEGTVNWTGTTLQSGSVLSLTSNGLLSVTGTSVKYFYGAITNAGRITYADAGEWRCSDGQLHNLAGGVFDFQRDGMLDSYSGTPLLVNAGIVRKSAGSGTSTCGLRILNSGRLEAQLGTLAFASGSVFSTGTVFAGLGTNTLPTGAVSFQGEVVSENLLWNGASLAGTSTLSGIANWSGGILESGASLTVATNGHLLISGSSLKYLNGSLTNAGTVIFGGTGDWRFNYSLVHNLPSGLFDLQGTGQLALWSGTPGFINEGTLRKSVGSSTTTIGLSMINSGRLEALVGSLAFPTGGFFKSGSTFAGAGTVALTGGTATLQGDLTSENLLWNGATVAGTATLVGTAVWNSGSLDAGAFLTIQTNAQLVLNGTGVKYLNGSLTNAGTLSFAGGTWRFNNSLLHIAASGVLDIPWDGTLSLWSGTPTLVNEGIVRKSAGTGTATIGVRLFNSGILDALSGTLVCASGSRFNDGTLFTGAGTNLFASGTLTVAGHLRSDNAVLGGATLEGTGSFEGSLTWLSGSIAANMSLTIPTNGQLNLLGSGLKNLSGGLTNAGLINWIGTGDVRFSGGSCHNLPGGLFDCRNNESLVLWTGQPVFVNEGTFRKSVGTGTTTCQLAFINRGAVEVNTGRALFSSGFTNAAGIIRLGGGVLQLTRSLALAGGVLTGFGTVSNAVINTGRVSPTGTGGPLNIVGDYTQTLVGETEFQLGGTTPGTNHSLLQITGDATLAGTISVSLAPGYLPNPGDSFNVLTYKSRAGDFACYNGFLFLGQNRRLLTQYSTTNLTLVTVTLPDPTNGVPRVTAQYPSALVCWPAEFVGYGLAFTTNLNFPTWTPLPGVTNRYYETPMVSEKFFRLWQP
jgi:hypothetical protein